MPIEIDNSVMLRMSKVPRKEMWWLAGAIIIAVVFKIGLLLWGVVPFNSDEAIVALMARHILNGSRPVFFYGQAYMGSLDAFLVAAMYKLMGTGIWAIRLVQIGLFSLTILTTALLGRRLSGNWKVGILAAWFLAIPNIGLTLYTTVSMGGYGEMLLIGNLILLTTLRISNDLKNNSHGRTTLIFWFVFGFLSGFGLWVFGLTLVYSLSALIYLIWYWRRLSSDQLSGNKFSQRWMNNPGNSNFSEKRILPYSANYLGFAFIGGIVGCGPWLAFAQQAGFTKLVSELGGGAIAGVESLSYLAQVTRHILNFGLFGTTAVLGLRPTWEIRWLAMPLAPFVLIFWLLVALYAFRKMKLDRRVAPSDLSYSHAPLLGGVVLAVVIGFILTPFGADPSGRYFLPIGVVMAIFASQTVWDWKVKWGNYVWLIVSLVFAFHIWGTIEVANDNPPGITTQIDSVTQIDHSFDQELIEFLHSEGEEQGYTNYWVAYPLAFLSEESLIYVPRLPYHQDLRYTSRDDRYSPYDDLMDQAQRTAYITTNNPVLDEKLRSGFNLLGVSYQETSIGDYQIFYCLSKLVKPEDIGLGGNEG